ncbi:MAG: hypothetical protein KJO98_14715 [Rhodothermia bacterium]|nr:hypothetical protein [Rhodothermia bacterium]
MPSKQLEAVLEACRRWSDPAHPPREEATEASLSCRNRFTAEAVVFAVNQQVSTVDEESLDRWIGGAAVAERRIVGVFNPGNIPFAGFQDLLAVLLTGHEYLGKVSSRSPYLLPAFVRDLKLDYPDAPVAFAEKEEVIERSEALIVTGTDETAETVARLAREHGLTPENILARGHRYSCAVVGRDESYDLLERLAEDSLLHEGSGCRTPAVIWAPAGSSPDGFIDALANFRGVFPAHPDTRGALKMQIAFHKALETPMAYADDDSFLVTRGEPNPQPPGHIRWAEYADLDEVRSWMDANRDALQLACITARVRGKFEHPPIPVGDVGHAQRPALGWHQDGRDVAAFLLSLR